MDSDSFFKRFGIVCDDRIWNQSDRGELNLMPWPAYCLATTILYSDKEGRIQSITGMKFKRFSIQPSDAKMPGHSWSRKVEWRGILYIRM